MRLVIAFGVILVGLVAGLAVWLNRDAPAGPGPERDGVPAPAGSSDAEPEWKPFADKECWFKAEFPGVPQRTTSVKDRLDHFRFAVERGGRRYEITYARPSDEDTIVDRTRTMTALLSLLARYPGAPPASELYDGRKVHRDLLLQLREGPAALRVWFVGSEAYILAVVGRGVTAEAPDVKRFFGGFAVRLPVERMTESERVAEAERVGDVALLIPLLGSTGTVRQAAVAAAGRIGAKAVPGLINALADRDEHIRAGAAEALGAVGSPAAAAVPPLLKLLDDGNEYVRVGALKGLLGAGRGRPEVVAAVADRLAGEPADTARGMSAAALLELGKADQPRLAALLGERSGRYLPPLAAVVRWGRVPGLDAAVPLLGLMGARAAPVLVSLLPADRRIPALLENLGLDAVPALLDGMSEKDERIPNLGSKLVLQIAGKADRARLSEVLLARKPSAIAALEKSQTVGDSRDRPLAVELLAGLGPDAAPALVRLLTAFGDPAPARTALVKMGAAALPALTAALAPEKGLDYRTSEVRTAAAQTLAQMGTAAAPAAPVLVETILTRGGHDFRDAGLAALAAIGRADRAALAAAVARRRDALMLVLEERGSSLPDEGIVDLAEAYGPEGAGLLVRQVAYPGGVRAKAALARLGSAAVPAIIEWLKTKRNGHGRLADALAAIGKDAAPAVPVLLDALNDNRVEDKGSLLRALAKLMPAKEVLPLVLPYLDKVGRDNWDAALAVAGLLKADPSLSASLSAEQRRYVLVGLRSAVWSREGSEDASALLVGLGAEAAPGLAAALSNEQAAAKAEALLRRIGAPAVPSVIESITVVGLPGWAPAIRVLKSLPADAVREGFRTRLTDGTGWPRWHVVQAALEVGPLPEAVDLLTGLLRNKRSNARDSAARMLGELGERASPDVVAALEEAAKDKSGLLQEAAKESLAKIRRGK